MSIPQPNNAASTPAGKLAGVPCLHCGGQVLPKPQRNNVIEFHCVQCGREHNKKTPKVQPPMTQPFKGGQWLGLEL